MACRVLGGQVASTDIVNKSSNLSSQAAAASWIAKVLAGFPLAQQEIVQYPPANAQASAPLLGGTGAELAVAGTGDGAGGAEAGGGA